MIRDLLSKSNKQRKSPDLHADDVVDGDGLEGVAVAEAVVRGDEVEPQPLVLKGNCIKMDLPGKSILRYDFQQNRTSQRPFLLQRIRFPGRPTFLYNSSLEGAAGHGLADVDEAHPADGGGHSAVGGSLD